MLEYWYKEKRTLTDFRRGVLGSYFDGFAEKSTKVARLIPEARPYLASNSGVAPIKIPSGVARSMYWF